MGKASHLRPTVHFIIPYTTVAEEIDYHDGLRR